jgi:hypothetical protein
VVTLMDMPYWLRVITVLLNTIGFALAGWMSVVRW